MNNSTTKRGNGDEHSNNQHNSGRVHLSKPSTPTQRSFEVVAATRYVYRSVFLSQRLQQMLSTQKLMMLPETDPNKSLLYLHITAQKDSIYTFIIPTTNWHWDSLPPSRSQSQNNCKIMRPPGQRIQRDVKWILHGLGLIVKGSLNERKYWANGVLVIQTELNEVW